MKNGNLRKVENPNAYKPWAVRSMCCRLQLDLTTRKKEDEVCSDHQKWQVLGSELLL